jgi:hypothetical protein
MIATTIASSECKRQPLPQPLTVLDTKRLLPTIATAMNSHVRTTAVASGAVTWNA